MRSDGWRIRKITNPKEAGLMEGNATDVRGPQETAAVHFNHVQHKICSLRTYS